MGPSLAGYGGVPRASAHRASSGQISLLREGDRQSRVYGARVAISEPRVLTEQEAAQTLLGLMGRMGLGEKQASAAILSQEALGLRFVPRAQFPFAECSS